MNQNIISVFEQLIQEVQTSNQPNKQFKIRSYRKVIQVIKALKQELKINKDDTLNVDLSTIKGIGPKSIDKIKEILKTNTLQSINKINNTKKTYNLEYNKLLKITGVGPAKAKKLLQEKHTLESLLQDYQNSEINLTHHQRLGLKYYHELEHRIPYKEIQLIEKYIAKTLKNIDSQLGFHICGSFRRKAKDSGDIDVLLYHNKIVKESDIKKMDNYLQKFTTHLQDNNFLVDHLTSTTSPTKYMGFCQLSPKHHVRRIDIRFVPTEHIASALLYFTGSGDFNKAMRTYALKKKFTINEYGIYTLDAKGNKKLRIKTKSESDIFRILGLDYVEPQDRLPTYKFPDIIIS